jgi:hypothetical protein
MPTSSFGCMIFDAIIALWFLAGAPSMIAAIYRTRDVEPPIESSCGSDPARV